MDKKFSHLTSKGNPTIVDISDKAITKRSATAVSLVKLPTEILDKFEKDEINLSKGPIFYTAILAGIMASKKTSELIPLCHPIPLNKCEVKITINKERLVEITATAITEGKTGVEMEALTAVSVAALTIYDMCKGFSHEIEILQTKLISKTGGKRDYHATS